MATGGNDVSWDFEDTLLGLISAREQGIIQGLTRSVGLPAPDSALCVLLLIERS